MGSASSSLQAQPVPAPAPPASEERLPDPEEAAAEHLLPADAEDEGGASTPRGPVPAPILAGDGHLLFEASLANPLGSPGPGLLDDGLLAREASGAVLAAAQRGPSLAALLEPQEEAPHGHGAVIRAYQLNRSLVLRLWMAIVHGFGPSIEPLPEDAEELCVFCMRSRASGLPLRLLPCGHRFHAECVDFYFTHGIPFGERSCPVRRAVIDW